MIEVHTSIDPEIIKARKFEATGLAPYAKPNLADFPQLHATQKTDTLVIGSFHPVWPGSRQATGR